MKDLLVITSYPPKGTVHNDRVVGVATYTKLLLKEIKQNHPDKKVTIFAEELDTKEHYEEDSMPIERRWKRNHIVSIFSMLTASLFRSEKNILISFEIYMFGGVFITTISLIFIALLRLLGKRIILILHQAPSSFSFVENPISAFFLHIGKSILYFLIHIATSEIIVFEKQLKENLGNNQKILVIPHFVPDGDQKNKIEARRELDLPKDSFILLYFGFLAPYKGVDLLIKQWTKSDEFTLIIAGGINPNHKDNASMKAHVRTIKQSSIEKHILVTDFVPEERIAYWFSACDTVILPYRSFLSSSGPLSLAFSYERPVLLSKPLAAYAKTPDIDQALHEAKLTIADITYDSSESLSEKLQWMRTYREKAALFSSLMKKSRNISSIADKFEKILFKP